MSFMPSTPSCRIVFLDSRPLNPGDLSWAPLEQLGHFVAYDKTEEIGRAHVCPHTAHYLV